MKFLDNMASEYPMDVNDIVMSIAFEAWARAELLFKIAVNNNWIE